MKERFVAGLLLAICCAEPAGAHAAEKSLAELQRQTEAVLALDDNIARRARIAPVFELAERYAISGETNKALEMYTKALEHQPWNLSAQLRVGGLLHGKGDIQAAREKAELVWRHAESDRLMAGAATMLTKPAPPSLPSQESWPGEPHALALVPIGEVDAWLLLAVRNSLSNLLGIPVVIRRVSWELPKPDRNPLHLMAEELRRWIASSQSNPPVRVLLRERNVRADALGTEDEVFAIAEEILDFPTDKTALRNLRENQAGLRRLGPQWDAARLATQLGEMVSATPGSRRGFLGLTSADLFAESSRFVFGVAMNGKNCGIMSYRRYSSAVTEEPPNRDRLTQRTVKQALSSTGLLFGLPRCSDPTCARAYANSLAEHDAKEVRLCSACANGFARRFGKSGD